MVKHYWFMSMCWFHFIKFSFFPTKYFNLQNQLIQVKKFPSVVALIIASVLSVYFIFLTFHCNFMESHSFVFHVS